MGFKNAIKIFFAVIITAAIFFHNPTLAATGTDFDTTTKNINIVRRLLAWGNVAVETPRRIDTIVVHTSYNAWGKDPFDVNGIIKQYKYYEVAPHFIIDRKGKIYELAPVKNIADHAGRAKMIDGRTKVNDFSVGIELVNKKDTFITDEQYASLADLIKKLKEEYPIEYIVGHDEITTIDKTDPWNFEWEKFNYLLYFGNKGQIVF
jgi:N-acetyl-anhydromuramyl-L-alanine amidase AmpD